MSTNSNDYGKTRPRPKILGKNLAGQSSSHAEDVARYVTSVSGSDSGSCDNASSTLQNSATSASSFDGTPDVSINIYRRDRFPESVQSSRIFSQDSVGKGSVIDDSRDDAEDSEEVTDGGESSEEKSLGREETDDEEDYKSKAFWTKTLHSAKNRRKDDDTLLEAQIKKLAMSTASSNLESSVSDLEYPSVRSLISPELESSGSGPGSVISMTNKANPGSKPVGIMINYWENKDLQRQHHQEPTPSGSGQIIQPALETVDSDHGNVDAENPGSAVKKLSQKFDGRIPMGIATIAGPPRTNSPPSQWSDLSGEVEESSQRPTCADNPCGAVKHPKVVNKPSGRFVTLVDDGSGQTAPDPIALAAMAEHGRRSGQFTNDRGIVSTSCTRDESTQTSQEKVVQ